MSLIVLCGFSSLTAQINKIDPDSITAVKDLQGNVGFIFPKVIAIEYMNIKKNAVQAKAHIDSLSRLVQLHESAKKDLELENVKLRQVVRNDSTAIQMQQATLTNTENELKKMKRRLTLWKIGTGSLAIAGFVIGIALGK